MASTGCAEKVKEFLDAFLLVAVLSMSNSTFSVEFDLVLIQSCMLVYLSCF